MRARAAIATVAVAISDIKQVFLNQVNQKIVSQATKVLIRES